MGGIIWLASYPKSGNTWTRTFIHNLLLNPKEPFDINQLSIFSLADGKIEWYERVGGKPFEEFSKHEILGLISKVHKAFTESSPDSVFVKTHSVLGSVSDTPLITMQYTAGAIYIVRNPLDVIISLADHFAMTLDNAIDFANNSTAYFGATDTDMEVFCSSWSGHVNSWMNINRQHMHIMRYEDMLDRPEETFGGMARFMGLNPPTERLDKAIQFSSFDVVRKQEDESGFIEQSDKNEKFFRAGKSGQWEDILSDKQVEKIVKCHYDTMKLFGYLPD
ncbi:MAG: sulfotransferase [Sneathiella sp.]|nr:MAG: sulfotransferase [Sneathiella sp.]